MKTKEDQKMRKRNMKLFPTYKKLGWDYLFYYAIDFMFLTQIKHISPADVVLASSFKSIFGIFLQIPANIIVEFLGRKNSIVLGNILNCIYMIIFMATGNIYDLILAKFVSCLAVSIKDIAEPGLLNSSIPPSKYKGNIFSKINSRGAAGYYILSSITKIIGGFLFEVNGYLPLICSLVVLIIVTIMSTLYIEPIKKRKEQKNEITIKKQLKDIEEGFKFIIKSERLKALILSASLIGSIITILVNYRTNLLQVIGVPAYLIAIISALLSFSSSYGSKMQKQLNDKFKNKTILVMGLTLSITTIIAGVLSLKAKEFPILIVIVVIAYIIGKFAHGAFFTIMDRYLRNFTNKDIDTKIFAVKNLFVNVISAISGIIASFMLNKMTIQYCMIIVGIAFTILYILIAKYMRKRVGLKPEEYSKQERKYDELY